MKPRTVVLAVGAIAILLMLSSQVDILRDGRTGYASDLYRDVIGADFVRQGESPYQRVTLQLGAEPHPVLPPEGWVAHAPLSIAIARALSAVAPVTRLELLGSIVGIASAIVVAALLARRTQGSRVLRFAVVAAVLGSAGTAENVVWLQGLGVLAILAIAVLELAERDRHVQAAVLLGAIGAVKVWPLFLALFLPGRNRPIRSASVAGGVAIGLTLVALPAVGGVRALEDWLRYAAPANLTEHLDLSFSFASDVIAHGTVLIGLYAFSMIVLTILVRSDPARPAIGATAHVVLAPLLWPHGVLWLTPALVWPIVTGRDRSPITIGAAFALPISAMLPAISPTGNASLGLTLTLGQLSAASMWAIRSYLRKKERLE